MYNETEKDSLLELYMFEATTLLDRLDGVLGRVRANGKFSRAEDVDVKRIMSTLSGSSDLMRYDAVSDAAFKTENMYEKASSVSLGEIDAIRLTDITSRIAAYLREELSKIENGEEISDLPEALEAEMSGFAELPETPPSEPDVAPAVVAETVSAAESSVSAEAAFILHVYFYEDSRMENVRAYLLTDKLAKIGNVTAAYPDDIENDTSASEYIKENGYYVALETNMFREQLEAMMKGTLSVESVSFVSSMPTLEQGTEVKSPEQKAPATPANTVYEPIVITIPNEEPVRQNTMLECIRVSVGGEIYALPISDIRESFITDDSAEDTVLHRDTLYPLIRIGEKLGVKNTVKNVSDGVLLLVSSGENQGCLLADKVVGKSTVKSIGLSEFLGKSGVRELGISGYALTDDEISLLLDPATFLREQKTL